jgi:hypothetical protein
MITREQIKMIAAEFFAKGNLTTVEIVTFPPIKNYLINSLNDAQLEWLSDNVQNKPNAIAEYLNSNAGRKMANSLFEDYRRTLEENNQQPKSINLVVSR